ncbi:MAG: MFS transporter [Cyanobacteria bacterium REEB67]|nr:MFS transporter [Cyanobacteria bacterium REEB67]
MEKQKSAAPYAGISADRMIRHRLILLTQVLCMVQAGVLTALVWTGQAQPWQLVILSGALGVITAFDMPIRQTFLVDMLDDHEQLTSAMGINASITTLTRLIGPFTAGLFVTMAGEKICFLVNALSYVAVIAALLFVRTKQADAPKFRHSAVSQMREGFDYTLSFTPIRDLIILIASGGLFAMPFSVLMPAFARDVFHGDATTLGLLTGASGTGSLIGALYLTSLKGTLSLSLWVILGCLLCGLSLVVFGCSKFLPRSLLAVAVTGFGKFYRSWRNPSCHRHLHPPARRGFCPKSFANTYVCQP